MGKQHPYKWKFRIYPEPNRSLYFLVKIYPTPKALRSDAVPAGIPKPSRSAWGCVHRYSKYTSSGGLTPEMGEIKLVQSALGAGVVAHECLHALIGWIRRVGKESIDAGGSVEEDWCYALQAMMKQIYTYCWDHKVIE